jgi:hypothetical protein
MRPVSLDIAEVIVAEANVCGACSRSAADSSLHVRESDGTPMAKLFICRFCRVEMEPIALADGSVVLACIDCEMIEPERDAARSRSGTRFSASVAVQKSASSLRRLRNADF